MPFDAGNGRDWDEQPYTNDADDICLSEVAIVLVVFVFFLSLVYFGG